MLAPFIGIYNGLPHRQRLYFGLFGLGMQGGQSWNAWLVPLTSLSNAASFRMGPGEWQSADGWDPLEGAVDNP